VLRTLAAQSGGIAVEVEAILPTPSQAGQGHASNVGLAAPGRHGNMAGNFAVKVQPGGAG